MVVSTKTLYGYACTEGKKRERLLLYSTNGEALLLGLPVILMKESIKEDISPQSHIYSFLRFPATVNTSQATQDSTDQDSKERYKS